MAAREVRFIWHLLTVASTIQIKKHSQENLNVQTPESFDERIIFTSLFNDIEWTMKGNTETCLPNSKQVAALATQFKPGHWCFLWPASEKTSCDGKFQRIKRKWDSVALQGEERRKQLPFPEYVRKQEDSHQNHIGNQIKMFSVSNLPVVWNWKSGTYTENTGSWHRLRRKSGQFHKLETTRCCNSQRIARRWFKKLPNRQQLSERWKMNNSTAPMNLSRMETVLFFFAENTQNQGILNSRDDKQFLPMSRSHKWLELMYSDLQDFGDWTASTVTTAMNVEVLGVNSTRNWTIRTTIYSYRDSPPKFWSNVIAAVIKLRATASAADRLKFASRI